MTAFADYVLQRKMQGAPDNDGGIITLSSPTHVVASGLDTATGVVPFGFTFNFDDTDYTQATVFSDGWLSFTGGFSNNYQNDQFDDVRACVGLFPWWGDLKTSNSGYVRYEQFGTAPNRYIVIDYLCYAYYNQSSGLHRELPFQIVLYETTNNIKFIYGTPTDAGTPTVFSDGVIGARTNTITAVNGNIREFTEKSGTPDPNGGVSTTPVELALSVATGADFPGDPTNAFEGEAFNFHFLATVVNSASWTNYGTQNNKKFGSDLSINTKINFSKNLKFNSSNDLRQGPFVLSEKGPASLRGKGKAYKVIKGE